MTACTIFICNSNIMGYSTCSNIVSIHVFNCYLGLVLNGTFVQQVSGMEHLIQIYPFLNG